MAQRGTADDGPHISIVAEILGKRTRLKPNCIRRSIVLQLIAKYLITNYWQAAVPGARVVPTSN